MGWWLWLLLAVAVPIVLLRERKIMASLQDLEAEVASVKQAVDDAAQRVINSLSGAITPEQLDTVVAALEDVKAAAAAIDPAP